MWGLLAEFLDTCRRDLHLAGLGSQEYPCKVLVVVMLMMVMVVMMELMIMMMLLMVTVVVMVLMMMAIMVMLVMVLIYPVACGGRQCIAAHSWSRRCLIWMDM